MSAEYTGSPVMVERVARAIHAIRFEDDDGPFDDEREMARAAIEATGLNELSEALREARLALEPVARRVFNDNGDHTINTAPLDADVYSACYYAARTVAAALSRSEGDVE